jgi:hypothetical protein
MKKKKLDGDLLHEKIKRIKSQSCGPGVTKENMVP